MANENGAALSIRVDDGSRRVPIENTRGEEIGAFTFHPTDIGIIERYNRLAEAFDAVTAPLEALGGEGADLADARYREALEEARRRVCAAVDELFGGAGAAEAFFGSVHPFSPVNGEFYCTQVLNAVGDYIGRQFETETARFSDRARKYARKATGRDQE